MRQRSIRGNFSASSAGQSLLPRVLLTEMGDQRQRRDLDDPPSKVIVRHSNSRILRLMHSPAPSGFRHGYVNRRAARRNVLAARVQVVVKELARANLQISNLRFEIEQQV